MTFRTILLAIIVVAGASLTKTSAQEANGKNNKKAAAAYIYRFVLTDKQGSGFSLKNPSRYLSRKSIERRKRQGLAVDSTDLPVSARYLKQFGKHKITVVGTSRWNNTVLVHTRDTLQLQPLKQLSCVKAWKRVWAAPDSIKPAPKRKDFREAFEPWDSIPETRYGGALKQIQSLGGDQLHNAGMRGEGMTIAIIDGGYKNANRIPALQKVNIAGHRDFVYPHSANIFNETDHGTMVLSTMATDQPHYLIGTAPRATYWLLRSEDMQSEQEVEEDYWAMAAEFADSVGVDIINSSLGYNIYDDSLSTYRLWQLDGHTALISHTASLLARKGIVLVNSAGNSGMGAWKKITVPADADDCITVGALTTKLEIAPFSSIGHTQDGRVKPDVVAIGSPATLINGRGAISEEMGTSFASPIVCGLVACLWQALPQKTALDIIQLVRQCSNNYNHPDNIYGYGRPDFWRAYQMGITSQPSAATTH